MAAYEMPDMKSIRDAIIIFVCLYFTVFAIKWVIDYLYPK